MVPAPSRQRALILLRRHGWLVGVLLVAGLLRLLVMVAYRGAFYFPDSGVYAWSAQQWIPYEMRPFGYSLFLKVFLPFHFRIAALVQHLIGVGLVIAGYAFLTRRGVARWLATLAVLPIAMDARQLAVEQYISAETLFVGLATAGLLALAWQDRLTTIPAALGGGLLAGAALTRTVGLPVIGLAVVYLLIRRVGWRPLAGAAMAIAILLGSYLGWYHRAHGVYAFGQYQGRFLAARVLSIADCDRIELTPQQRQACPDRPIPGGDQHPDQYIWSAQSPLRQRFDGVANDPFLNSFAWTVIRQQPMDYGWLVLRQTAWHFWFAPPVDEQTRCDIRSWRLPRTPSVRCQARMYVAGRTVPDGDLVPVPATPLTSALSWYSRFVITPGPLLALGPLIAAVLLVWRRRRPGVRLAGDALLLAGGGLTLVVVSVATSMYDMRYLLPALMLIPLGSALAAGRLLDVARPAPPEPAIPRPRRPVRSVRVPEPAADDA